MATTFDFVISCPEEDAARARRTLDRAHELVAILERQLSEFIEGSPVNRLNQSRAFEKVPAPDCLIDLLERSEKLRIRTQNAFHCTTKSPAHVPLPAIAWDPVRHTAWKLHDEARISFGAIGKGYAIDEARKLIVIQGFNDFLLSAGGSSISLSGFAGPDQPWRWGWSWKKDQEGNDLGLPLSHSSGLPLSLGVSGTHEKGEHIIRNHVTSEKGPFPQSALIAVPSATDADALSTALFAAGWDSGLPLLGKEMIPPAAACIDTTGVPRWNGIFQKLFGPVASMNAMIAIALFAASSLVSAPSAPASESAQMPQAAQVAEATADESIDLGSMGLEKFTPYVTERNPLWAALPVAFGLFTLLHLMKLKKRTRRSPQ